MTRYWGEQDRQVPQDALDAYQRAEAADHTIRELRREIDFLRDQIVDLHRENLSLKVKLGMVPDPEAC